MKINDAKFGIKPIQFYSMNFETLWSRHNGNLDAMFSDPGLKGALHPALRPNNVHPILKMKYQIPAMARMLFRDMQEPLDEYRDILDKSPIDNVGYISGQDGFKFIDTQYESVSGVILGYGGAFRMTMPEMRWSRIGLVADKMRQLTYLMRKFYEKQVLTAMVAGAQNSFTVGTAWTNLTTGDPFADIEKAKGLIRDTSGFEADVLIMNRNVYNTVIVKRKEYREYQLNGIRGTFMGGNFELTLTPNGLGMIVFDTSLNSIIADDKVYVARTGAMGVNHIAIPFTSTDRTDPNSPFNRLYYAWEWATPATDKRDGTAICEIDITP